MFFNKSKKNQIIRCCKKCKDDNTFSILNKPNEIKKKRVQFANAIATTTHYYDDDDDDHDLYDHGYAKHQEIYKRILRTKSSPQIKSPQLKSLASTQKYQHRSSTPLLLNKSCTTTIKMQPRSPTKTSKRKRKKNKKPLTTSMTCIYIHIQI